MSRKLIIPGCLILALGITNPANADLVGWWTFDETSGNIAHDSSGYGNHGVLYGGLQLKGGGLEFDGVDDYVDCGGDESLNITDEVTVMAWIKLTGPAPDRKIAGNQDGITGGYKFGVYSDMLEFEIRTADNTAVLNRSVSGGTILEQGVYHHVAGVYSSQGGYIRTYVNGVLDRELSTTAALGTSTGTFKIGREPFSDSYFWLGFMDDVRVYNRALTQDEIQAIAQGEENPFASNPNPEDGAIIPPDTWVTLSWTPGAGAVSHDVYFGDNFDDVNNGISETFRGNQISTFLIVGLPGFPYPDGLVPGTTYYWRIDEIGADGTVYMGAVWSFTVAASDFFYNENGVPIPVTIALDRLGAVVADGVTIDDVEAFIASLDLQLLEIVGPGGLVILGLQEPLDRQSLVELARDIESIPDVPFTQVGLVLNAVLYRDPFIMTDEFIAQFKADVTREQIEAFNSENAVRIVMENPFVKNQFLLTASEASRSDALTMANLYYESDLTGLAYPNFIGVFYDEQTIPNDTLFGDQWHLDNTGQGGGTTDADADLPEAWDITMGDPDIIIAVIENGGFDMSHADLTPNRWVNPGEDLNGDGTIQPAEINGVDDDGNTFDDDFYGWDFAVCISTSGPGCGDNDPSPAAGEDHGTAVAGVAGARGDNNMGISSSCPNCSLMFLRTGYVTNDWSKSLAFDYARQEGAQIITNSWSVNFATPNIITAINNATAAGVVVLFAARNNNNLNVCSGTFHDPRVSHADVIAVSSSTNLDQKAVGGSGYQGCSIGNCIDILAPSWHGDTHTRGITTADRTGIVGYNNTSSLCVAGLTEPANRAYTNCFGGTSSATPLTAGAVGLILSVNPSLTRLQVQRLLQDTTDKIEDSAGDYDDNNGFSNPTTGVATHSWGRLNAFEAVRIAAPISVSPNVVGGKGGVDIFLRDNRLDWGNTEQPSNVLFEPTRGFIGHWRSMDIKVDAPPHQPAPTAATFDAFVDETPSAILGQTNKVYVRVRNRGPVTAASVTVKLHWTQFGTALPALPGDFWTAFPVNSTDTTQWHPLNCSGSISSTCTISNMAYSGSSVAGTTADAAQIVQFDFPAPTVDPGMPNHFCLLAMVDSPQDRILPKSRPAAIPADFVVDILTPNDNNVTHRNYKNLPTSASDTFDESFFVRNPYSESITAVLTLDAPKGWEVQLDNLFFDAPFVLGPREEILVKMYVHVPSINVTGDVTIIQTRIDTEIPMVMGGVTYRFGSALACPTDIPGFKIRSLKPLMTDGWGYDAMNEILDTGLWMGLPALPGSEGERVSQFVNLYDSGDRGAFSEDNGYPDESFPGIDAYECPAQNPADGDDDDNFATEVLGYIQLTAGQHIIGVNSDDGTIIEIGGVEIARTAEWKGATNVDFVFEVTADGCYPLRALHMEGAGGASFELHEVLTDGTRILLNDVANGGSAVFTPVIPLPAPKQVDPGNNGLVAYYPLDDNTDDSSGNGLHGTMVGDPAFVDGVKGMALDFNGDDYVDCDGNAEFSFTDAMTVSTWVNIRSVNTAWMAMIAKGENAWRLGINNETTGIHYAFSGGTRDWQQANTATELTFDEWYHIAATYDTNVGALVYINGVSDASNPNLDGIDTNDMPLLLGDNPEATGRLFDGMLDEVRIYNRALSEDEISFLAGLR